MGGGNRTWSPESGEQSGLYDTRCNHTHARFVFRRGFGPSALLACRKRRGEKHGEERWDEKPQSHFQQTHRRRHYCKPVTLANRGCDAVQPLEVGVAPRPARQSKATHVRRPASRPYFRQWQYLLRRSDLETASFLRCDSADHVLVVSKCINPTLSVS